MLIYLIIIHILNSLMHNTYCIRFIRACFGVANMESRLSRRPRLLSHRVSRRHMLSRATDRTSGDHRVQVARLARPRPNGRDDNYGWTDRDNPYIFGILKVLRSSSRKNFSKITILKKFLKKKGIQFQKFVHCQKNDTRTDRPGSAGSFR